MAEDTPVNTGVVTWPRPDSAYVTVRRMQIKLHRWASEDPARRFGDLFNLVYDPAFLVHAWERVRQQRRGTDRGGRPGHGGPDRGPDRGRGVPGPDPGLAEVGRVPAGRGAAGDDPEGGGKASQAGDPDRGRPGGPGQPEGSAGTDLRGGLSSRARTGSARTGARRTRSPRSTTWPPEDYHWVLEADIEACFDEIDRIRR